MCGITCTQQVSVKRSTVLVAKARVSPGDRATRVSSVKVAISSSSISQNIVLFTSVSGMNLTGIA